MFAFCCSCRIPQSPLSIYRQIQGKEKTKNQIYRNDLRNVYFHFSEQCVRYTHQSLEFSFLHKYSFYIPLMLSSQIDLLNRLGVHMEFP